MKENSLAEIVGPISAIRFSPYYGIPPRFSHPHSVCCDHRSTPSYSPPADTSDANSDDDSDDSGAATDRDVRAIRPATAGCCTPAVAAFPHAHFTFIHPNPPTEASHSRIHPPSVCPRSPETSTACPRVPRTSLQGAPPLFVYRSNGHSITRIQYHCPSGSQGLQ